MTARDSAIEVLSIVSFNQPGRTTYLERSFSIFHDLYPEVRHVVVDGSNTSQPQAALYEKLGIEAYFRNTPYSERLKFGLKRIQADYFVFLPDDFTWIFRFPLEEAIGQCRAHRVDELKLSCRGMPWFADPSAPVVPWFDGDRLLATGERLRRYDDLLISGRMLRRDFTEQFSLASNLIRTEFIRKVVRGMPDNLPSPSAVEKRAYLQLYLRLNLYRVGYYKMWIPAFHFIDLAVEGEKNAPRAADQLVPENFARYNRAFNGQP